MSSSRWIRLDTTWSQSPWLAELEPEARLAWIELLCHTKAHGFAGSVKRLSPAVAARMWGLRVTSVTDMERAAVADNALVVDGDEWVVCGWSERQSDPKAAERMRRYRERQSEDTPVSHTDPVTRNNRNVTPTETKTETGTRTETETPPPLPPHPVEEDEEDFSTFPPALERYITERVPEARRYAYRATVRMWLTGGRESVWIRRDGGKAPERDRMRLLEAAATDLAASDEEKMARPLGDPANLQTKLSVLIAQEYRETPRRYEETPGGGRSKKAGEPTRFKIGIPERDKEAGITIEDIEGFQA